MRKFYRTHCGGNGIFFVQEYTRIGNSAELKIGPIVFSGTPSECIEFVDEKRQEGHEVYGG